MKIKYMGVSDVRRLEKGEHFNGRLNEKYALDGDIEWNWENNHIIDTDDFPSVDDEFWTMLLEERFPDEDPYQTGPEWLDVTDKKRIPTNAAQQMWRAAPKNEDAETVLPRQSEADTEAATAGGVSGTVNPAKPARGKTS